MLLNCGVGEDSWESLELRGDPTSPPNGNQSWIFIGRTDAEAETLNTLAVWCEELTHWKRLWCWGRLKQEEKGTTEDQMIGWHHQVNGHEFKQAQGVGDGQGSLTCCSPWGHKESDTTEWLNWTEKKKCVVPLMQFTSLSDSVFPYLCWLQLPPPIADLSS